jgi:geranylgeranyl diphosphate synthase type II
MLSKHPSAPPLLDIYQKEVEKNLRSSLSHFGETGILREACEYALLNGGKRFRPALVLAVSKGLNEGLDAMEAALAIEFFHTASLIADDLPCMDNDDERRQKPSLHKIYGEATALLATYALIAAGYENLYRNAQALKKNPRFAAEADTRCVLALENVSYNTGVQGATGGQCLDLFPHALNMPLIREVLQKKTISLFEIAFVLGWLFGGGELQKLPLIKKAAGHFGMAFQIADDIEDFEQDKQKERVINTALFLGKEKAHQLFLQEIQDFDTCLDQLEWPAHELRSLISLISRSS